MTVPTDTHESQDLAMFVHKQSTHWMDWTRISSPFSLTGLVRQAGRVEVPNELHFARCERVFLVYCLY